MINDNNKHSWCVNADHAMSANNDGTTKICCMIENDEDMGLSNNTIQENFQKIEFVKIREELQQGIRNSKCRLCWEEEDAGRKSKRLRDNEKYIGHVNKGGEPFIGLAKFELNLGNTCNLKCRTCAPHSSSTWMQEDFDVYRSKELNFTYKIYAQEMKKYHQTFDDESPFWDDLESNLSTIKQFDFYGGEPFMSKKMWKTLQLAVDKGYSKDIEVHYATNATQWPTENIKILKHFRHLNLNFSIDGIGDKFEYVRYPAVWEEAKGNMLTAYEFSKTHHDIHISWCVTLSNMNIFYLPEQLDVFYKDFSHFGLYLNLVHGPKYFNISYMPDDVKEKLVAKLESINPDYLVWQNFLPGVISFIKAGKYDEYRWKQFKEKIKLHDAYRKQDFATTFPEWAEIIGFNNE
jgi:sulfatase maturation enzyme AslB (radical SAM superfamily)